MQKYDGLIHWKWSLTRLLKYFHWVPLVGKWPSTFGKLPKTRPKNVVSVSMAESYTWFSLWQQSLSPSGQLLTLNAIAPLAQHRRDPILCESASLWKLRPSFKGWLCIIHHFHVTKIINKRKKGWTALWSLCFIFLGSVIQLNNNLPGII